MGALDKLPIYSAIAVISSLLKILYGVITASLVINGLSTSLLFHTHTLLNFWLVFSWYPSETARVNPSSLIDNPVPNLNCVSVEAIA